MEFQVLGPVRACTGGRSIDLGDRKERLVLAVLLLEPNQLVPVDRLVDLLWREGPPTSARRIVQAHLSRLRARLTNAGADRADIALVRRGPGYVLNCDPQRIDVHEFRGLVNTARRSDDLRTKARLLRQALALWQGPAMADAATDDVRRRLCPGLDEARLTAAEERFDAELRLGHEVQIVDELTDLVGRHPHRQRLAGQLMLAQYRLGRTADAVALYARLRRRLDADLGLEPSAELQQLHVAILRADPALHRIEPAPAGPVSPAPVPPAQLPAAAAGFAGRRASLAGLDRATDPDSPTVVPVAVVTGGPGVGKTALAVQWAHRRLDRFPDGQLYVDLGGHSSRTGPLTPMAALAALLGGLGASPPEALTEAVARYRSALAGRRVVIVLDDARSAEQVRPLLPGSPSCAVVVTSRNRLGGLVAHEGARQVRLDVLAAEEAHELLARGAGEDRVRAEPGVAADLARLCGHLPLALRISAVNLAGWHGSLASYGAAPGVELTVDAVAALGAVSAGVARQVLGQLVDANLVDARDGRYTVRDLTGCYAARCLSTEDGPGDATAATRRLGRWYRERAAAAADLLGPSRPRRPADPVFPDRSAAREWVRAQGAALRTLVPDAGLVARLDSLTRA